ncbi:hypothetical protein ACHAXS_005949 [Conticribra weissflogii]
MDASNREEAAFPTAATVPFPFETPYDVQRDLMDAILTSLRRCQENDGLAGVGVPASQLSGSDIIFGEKDCKKKRKAQIIMLESPTGTGKSLSLACASMAWLRYCEAEDIKLMAPSGNLEKSNSNEVVNPSKPSYLTPGTGDTAHGSTPWNPSSSLIATPQNNSLAQVSSLNSNKKKYDWLDSWQPNQPNQIDSAAENSMKNSSQHRYSKVDGEQLASNRTKEEQIKQHALESRSALDNELNNIRSRLDRLVNVSEIAADSSKVNNKQNQKDNSREKERNLRENLVRSGVASAMARERKMQRKKERFYPSKNKQNASICTKRTLRIHNRKLSEEDVFLVEEYYSDDEFKPALSSESDDDSVDDKRKDERKATDPDVSMSAKFLLDGCNLDGSAYNHSCRKKKSWTTRPKDHSNDESTVAGVTPGSGFRKIIYAARTHSQLTQFIGELRRTHWGSNVKVVALGSRSLLCGNDDVLYSSREAKLRKNRRSEAEITEMCLDMQKSKENATNGGADANNDEEDGQVVGRKRSLPRSKSRQQWSCPFLSSPESVATLALHSLVRPSDIEDMASLGRASHACSYYASREAIAAAEVVALPYNTLLSPEARKSIGLSIKNALIVVDEAHNIPETLRNISSCQLSLPVAETALSQLTAYTQKYSDRLAGKNLSYLGQIRKILTAIIKFLKRSPKKNESNQNGVGGFGTNKEMLAAVELMFKLKLDNINLFSILKYLEKSRLSQKLLGFVNHTACCAEGLTATVNEKTEFVSKHISSLAFFETFLERLTTTDREGKVIVERPSEELSNQNNPNLRSNDFGVRHPTLQFIRIQSTCQMSDIVDEAYAIILAGGTLRPFSHVATELFGDDVEVMNAASEAEHQLTRNYDNTSITTLLHKPKAHSSMIQLSSRLTTFTCGHVIPQTNVITCCLSFGPSSKRLDFRHTSRSSDDMIDELGRSLLNLCNVVPSGLVVFLPSYKYESQVFQRWRSTGILSQIEKKKKVHREPKNSRELEAALVQYSTDAITLRNGAMLFSVMGGKMSEGINFSDDMARCVLVVGLPYPDITDPVLKEKMESLDKELRDRGSGISGQAYYQNLCMRTVNQSIGRAIRHANDYASIVLADFRYTSDPRIWRGLPQWLRRGCDTPGEDDAVFGRVLKNIKTFFADR